MQRNTKSTIVGITALSTLAAGSYYLYKYLSSKSNNHKSKTDYELYGRPVIK